MNPPEALQQSTLNHQMHDIYHIAFLLRQKLVPDLIAPILDYAEIYWSSANETQVGKYVRVPQSNAPREVLTSDGVESKARVRHPVRKVVFKITSHDQGWASSRDSGSWTWFTARKLLHGGALPSETADADQASSQGMEVCRNLVADKKWYTHEVTWRADSHDRNQAGWVSSLMIGDRVLIKAWAMFPGWVNKVQHASITIYTTAIV